VAEAFDPALRRRVLSAAVLIALALAGVVAGGWGFGLLVLACAAVLALEWAALAARLWPESGGGGAAVAGALALAVPALAVAVLLLGLPAGYALALLIAGAALAGLAGGLLGGTPAGWAAAGVLYFGLPALALVWLRTMPGGAGLATVLWLFVVVWATDIAAYAVGRTVGGPRLAPRISPGKTWSGLWGGVAGAALAGAVGAALIPGSNPGTTGRVLAAGAVGAVLAVIGQLGDLAESFLKRRAGIKDSGALIPGHGGALDRLDSLLATAPALGLLVLLLRGPAGEGGLPWWP
jgi:phosphatidate cytidylyltransferase